MIKRIRAVMLSITVLVAMLFSTATAFAASTVIHVTADKTEAEPGDTVSFTITLGPVSDMGCMQMVLDIPEGLTYVENSGKLADDLRKTLGFDLADFTEKSKMINGVASKADYSSESDTVICTFQCTVDEGFSGNAEVGLSRLKFTSCQPPFENHTPDYSVQKALIKVSGDVPADPATPDEPAIPDNPDEPVVPGGNTDPVTPDEPVKPAEPDDSGKTDPIAPDDPEPSGKDEPGEQGGTEPEKQDEEPAGNTDPEPGKKDETPGKKDDTPYKKDPEPADNTVPADDSSNAIEPSDPSGNSAEPSGTPSEPSEEPSEHSNFPVWGIIAAIVVVAAAAAFIVFKRKKQKTK